MKNFIAKIAQQRKTTKVRVEGEDWTPQSSKEDIEALLEAAHWAPFHYSAHHKYITEDLPSEAPWRFHVIDGWECKKLKNRLLEEKKGLKSVDAICQMLAAAEACIVINWLPAIDIEGQTFPNVVHVENIAAASAATQSLLLSATENEYKNYWYTGGVIRFDSDVWNWLGIEEEQKYLLGVVFLFPKEAEDREATLVSGANREKRGNLGDWFKWITLS